MIDLSNFADFHFLRPQWLLAIIPALLLLLFVYLRDSVTRRWRGVIAPHLLSHLLIRPRRRFRIQPVHLVVVTLILAALGVAGPTWEREETPFTEDKAPLVVAMDVSYSMDAIDIRPTRLERAKQKVRDLLSQRGGARTGLIAYAGTAHTVLPLTEDRSVIEMYLMALASNVMPVAGKDPAQALALAEDMLAADDTSGSILFVTDGIAQDYVQAFVEHDKRSKDQIVVLAVGTREGGPIRVDRTRFAVDASGRRKIVRLNTEGLDALAREANAVVVGVTLEDDDMRRIQRGVQSHLEKVQEEDAGARWRDVGYYLVLPVVVLTLLWFRRGWTIRWVAGIMLVVFITPVQARDFHFADLWLTHDQQGRYYFEKGDFVRAAELFEDPMWKGIAFYRAGDWEHALLEFVRVDTAEGAYNLGNTYAQIGGEENFEAAVQSYESALQLRPDWPEAQANRDLVLKLLNKIKKKEPEEEETPPGGDPTFDPDEIKFDEKGKKGKSGELEETQLRSDQLAEIWLRSVRVDPAEFLRLKFAQQAAEEAQSSSSRGGRR